MESLLRDVGQGCDHNFHDGHVWSKAKFVESFPRYGYKGRIDSIRATEFKRLESTGMVYLDHGGSTLYSESQVRAMSEELERNVYGNPHSGGPASAHTTEKVENVRSEILAFFGVNGREYDVVFTAGATAALKIVGETFPWHERGSEFLHTADVHNSVLGIRELAFEKGACVKELRWEKGVDESELVRDDSNRNLTVSVVTNLDCRNVRHSTTLQPKDMVPPKEETGRMTLGVETTGATAARPVLLAMPAECNFSGCKPNVAKTLAAAQEAMSMERQEGEQECRWYVLLDAAKFACTSPLNLACLPEVDFMCVSFYKMFGLPCGIGALVAKKESLQMLMGNKRFFGGGTVSAAVNSERFHVLRNDPLHAAFEDGTIAFTSILQLKHGLDIMRSLSMAAIRDHVCSLAMYTAKTMLAMKHRNDKPMCELYGMHSLPGAFPLRQGGVVAFNLFHCDGSYVGYAEVDKLASLHNIQLRTGCFCNPGACQTYLRQTAKDIKDNLAAGHVCWDENDLVEGRPTGAIRVSFGYMSTWEDARIVLNFFNTNFVSRLVAGESEMRGDSIFRKGSPVSVDRPFSTSVKLKSIIVYPIKSCAGYEVTQWPIGPNGLFLDREWTIVDPNGKALRLKAQPKLAHVQPHLDLEKNVMRVSAPGMETLVVPFERARVGKYCRLNLCGLDASGTAADDKSVSDWFSCLLGADVLFVRCLPTTHKDRRTVNIRSSSFAHSRVSKLSGGSDGSGDELGTIGFANEGQYLLISEASYLDFQERVMCATREGSDSINIRPIPGTDWARYFGLVLLFVVKCQILLASRLSLPHKAFLGTTILMIYRFLSKLREVGGDRSRPWNIFASVPSLSETPREFVAAMDDNSCVKIESFRANFVVTGSNVFEEDRWTSLSIGPHVFSCVGHCSRCKMINVDPITGEVSDLPLRVLSSYRRSKSSVFFGQFLRCVTKTTTNDAIQGGGGDAFWVGVDMEVHVM